MESNTPRVIENREFVELEEEDIHKLNRIEAAKFDRNPEMEETMTSIRAELGDGGRWEEHWVTVDASGRRMYSRVYATKDHTVAIAADGRVIRDTIMPAHATGDKDQERKI